MSARHKEIHTETVDHSTGEVLSHKNIKTYKAIPEPTFIKMYVDDIASIMRLTAPATRLLLSMATRVGYDSVITLSNYVKEEIAKDMGVNSVQQVSNNITVLISAGAMVRLSRSTFMLNPDYFAKGKWRDITRLKDAYIKLVITYVDGKKKTTSETGDGVLTTKKGDKYIIDSDGGRVYL